MQSNAKTLAQFIDHTLLKPDATKAQIQNLCAEAREHNFFGVCVNSSWVPTAVSELQGTGVKTVAVVGFPLGACSTASKVFETGWCVDNGAHEIDMVLALGLLKGGSFADVENDIRAVVQAAKGAPVKVILETSLLNNAEKEKACQISLKAGAQFVKTSTGFGGGGATVEDIQLMAHTVGKSMGVKASGGIKSTQMAFDLIAAGATRLGTSSGVSLIANQASGGTY